jgi:hypothetical protein
MRGDSRSIRFTDEVFRRLSFGCDGSDGTGGTGATGATGGVPGNSTAVACGLILCYLDRMVDSRILPVALEAESLQGSSWSDASYPRAARLYAYLLRYGRLKAGIFGRWGRGVARRFRRFWRAKRWSREVIVRCRFGGYGAKKAWKLVTEEIDASHPAMVTVWSSALRGAPRGLHTVAVCGYHITPGGRRELLVHTGRYGDFVKGGRAQLVTIPVKSVVCSYRFDVQFLLLG